MSQQIYFCGIWMRLHKSRTITKIQTFFTLLCFGIEPTHDQEQKQHTAVDEVEKTRPATTPLTTCKNDWEAKDCQVHTHTTRRVLQRNEKVAKTFVKHSYSPAILLLVGELWTSLSVAIGPTDRNGWHADKTICEGIYNMVIDKSSWVQHVLHTQFIGPCM